MPGTILVGIVCTLKYLFNKWNLDINTKKKKIPISTKRSHRKPSKPFQGPLRKGFSWADRALFSAGTRKACLHFFPWWILVWSAFCNYHILQFPLPFSWEIGVRSLELMGETTHILHTPIVIGWLSCAQHSGWGGSQDTVAHIIFPVTRGDQKHFRTGRN